MDTQMQESPASRSLTSLHRAIRNCTRCPRLVRWRTRAARDKTKRYSEWTYWGRPVPGFGDPAARLVIVGLAPAAHGANRTGRMFTGDRSGDWLYRALHKHGYANQRSSTHRADGLELSDCYVTAACRCAPPQNKPTRVELMACLPFLLREFAILSQAQVLIGLGKIGFDSAFDALVMGSKGRRSPRPRFGHDAHTSLEDGIHLIGSYHPSQQNTFTGRLTEPMFDAVFRRASRILKSTEPS